MAFTSTGHIRKRQYQPSITSYLNRDASTTHVSSSAGSLSLALPEETQASLLSVGMRVRKSVPEGYKTHNSVKTQGYAFPSSAPPASTSPAVMTRENMRYKMGGVAELQPFCGLHKTGGWAAQEVPSSSAPAVMQLYGYSGYSGNEENVSELTWSQSTIAATQSSFAAPSAAISTSRKRGYEEEIEDDLDAFFNDYDFDNAITSTRSNTLTLRPIARLKSSGKRTMDDGIVRVVGGNDFDDAAFLVPDEGMDTD